MFANLLCAVLAVAVLTAPFVGEVNRDIQFAPDSVSAVADAHSDSDNDRLYSGSYNGRQVKRAYYDPDGTYGTEEGKIYYYSSETLLTPQASSFPMNYSFSTGASPDLAFAPNGTLAEVSALDSVQLDFYVDGSFSQTIEASVRSLGPDYARKTNLYNFYSTIGLGHYIWVFDHEEPAPVNPGVEILGDIAEGLTGGIVPVAEGIGGGLQALVSKIFLNADGTGLSLFGIVSVCFAGLALAIGLSRWIVNFVASLGARNR